MARTTLPMSDQAKKPTIGFVNLGCTKNQVDAEVMLGSLSATGFELTSKSDHAEVVIVNTCGFIEEAKQESINAIIEYGRLKKTGACRVLIAAGCLAQRYQDDLLKELPELDAVVGTGEIGRIADICRTLLNPTPSTPRSWMAPPPYLYDELAPRIRLGKMHTAYVKIAEGCNRNCTFCAIPLMRGKQRSRPIESIVKEAEQLADQGVKELSLISQDTVNYGADLGVRDGLTGLLRELVKVKGLRWIRPFYLYPQQVTDELMDLYAGKERLAKYIDMPLQHINDTMLKRMHRLGDRASITRLVQRLRQRIPGLTFRTAFIVGFPGESEQAFAELKAYLVQMQFDRVAVFLYSDEEGTPAALLDGKVDRAIMEERRNELLALQEGICLQKSRAKVGATMEVLVDGPSEEAEGLWEARHEGQGPEIDGVVYVNKGQVAPGDLVKATITDATAYDLVGRVEGECPQAARSSPLIMAPPSTHWR
ncbi:MAG: 30S ribosomal protein S12 methylthiotransferase RimO [Nitrospirae bacterium]|nr:30S ribosomal protein S12 methylthiotransferase RimO [Nitrospirota bacterium]